MNNRDIWLTARGKISLTNRVLIMGVLNITPDSFSDGGMFTSVDSALERAWDMVKEGADIIDVGAESTRPDAEPVTAEIELARLVPVLEKMCNDFPVPISVDTYKAVVADGALSMGVEIVNDISGLKRDPDMAAVVARHRAGLVIMHMRGDSKTMQSRARYGDLIGEVKAELEESVRIALEAEIELERMVFDPGIGFAKDYIQSCILINHLDELSIMQRPLLIGLSRKSYIGKILGLPVGERLEGTIAACVLSVERGADILRVHDVKEVKRAVEVTKAIIEESHNPA